VSHKVPHAFILSRGLDPFVIVQPVTPQAYAALSCFPMSETGAIALHVDDFESPDGPISVLDGEGLSTVTIG
jgi:hypothetical protein